MLKIAICDDELNELNRTKNMCQTFKAKHPESNIKISTFSSSSELKITIANQESYDIFLLDIYMPDMTGTDLARFIREDNESSQIIFLTTSNAHAVEAFSLHATHYLVKPYTVEQFDDAMNKAVQAIEKRNKAQITLKTSEGLNKVCFADLLYSETNKHLQLISLEDGKCLQVRITSAQLFELLSADNRFFKCGSTYIVNIGKIEEITKDSIVFENGKRIPMQRRQYKELIDRYTSYALEGN